VKVRLPALLRGPVGVRTQLVGAMVVVAIVTAALVGLLTHRAVDESLVAFGKRDLRMTAVRTASSARFAFETEGGWSEHRVRQLVHDGGLENHTVVIWGADGQPVPGSPRTPAPDSVPIPIEVGGEKVGTVITGHKRGGYLQLAGDRKGEGLTATLEDTMGHRLIEAGVLAGGLALLLALAVALRMARPLQRLTEVARRMANGEIETRAGGLGGSRETRELGHTLDRLAAALRRQDELRRATVHDVAHELRGALVGVTGRLEALQDGMIADEKTAIDRTARDARRLNQLVDDVLLLADAQSPSLLVRKCPVDLNEVCAERAAAHADGFAERRIEFECRIAPAHVDGDAGRLAQIVDNLLSNARRYTDPGGRVQLRLEVRDGEAVLQVVDSGIGIASEHLARIFDRFWRDPEARERVAEGSGVGLALVRDLVVAHDGRVEAESRPGMGSTFSVFLPLAGDPEADELLVREPAPDGLEAAQGTAPTVWRLRGEIDTANAARVEGELLDAVDRGAVDVVLDLTDVAFIDSSGLGSLVAVAAEVRAGGGHFVIVAGPPHVKRVFDLLQADEFMDLVDTRGAAIAALAGADARQ
jgi:anti-anti-sigma factor